MIDIDETRYGELYSDFNKCLEFLKTINSSEIKDNVNFHMYWKNVRQFERKQILPIKSFLTTQNLEKTNLTLWSNVDLTNNEYLRPVLPYINFKIYNPLTESQDTIIYGNTDKLIQDDNLVNSGSDLFRLIVLNKYGGIYVDMDVLLLRDFSPILDQEFAYKWELKNGQINNAVISIFKRSRLSQELLNGVLQIPVTELTSWGCINFMRAKKITDFTVFPCAFFDADWTGDNLNNTFKKMDCVNLFDGAFSWHWHNRWNTPIEDGSKFQIYEERINKKFKEMFG